MSIDVAMIENLFGEFGDDTSFAPATVEQEITKKSMKTQKISAKITVPRPAAFTEEEWSSMDHELKKDIHDTILKSTKSPRPDDNIDGLNGDNACKFCGDNVAKLHCKECQVRQNLCVGCSEIWHGHPARKGHTPVSINDGSYIITEDGIAKMPDLRESEDETDNNDVENTDDIAQSADGEGQSDRESIVLAMVMQGQIPQEHHMAYESSDVMKIIVRTPEYDETENNTYYRSSHLSNDDLDLVSHTLAYENTIEIVKLMGRMSASVGALPNSEQFAIYKQAKEIKWSSYIARAPDDLSIIDSVTQSIMDTCLETATAYISDMTTLAVGGAGPTLSEDIEKSTRDAMEEPDGVLPPGIEELLAMDSNEFLETVKGFLCYANRSRMWEFDQEEIGMTEGEFEQALNVAFVDMINCACLRNLVKAKQELYLMKALCNEEESTEKWYLDPYPKQSKEDDNIEQAKSLVTKIENGDISLNEGIRAAEDAYSKDVDNKKEETVKERKQAPPPPEKKSQKAEKMTEEGKESKSPELKSKKREPLPPPVAQIKEKTTPMKGESRTAQKLSQIREKKTLSADAPEFTIDKEYGYPVHVMTDDEANALDDLLLGQAADPISLYESEDYESTPSKELLAEMSNAIPEVDAASRIGKSMGGGYILGELKSILSAVDSYFHANLGKNIGLSTRLESAISEVKANAVSKTTDTSSAIATQMDAMLNNLSDNVSKMANIKPPTIDAYTTQLANMVKQIGAATALLNHVAERIDKQVPTEDQRSSEEAKKSEGKEAMISSADEWTELSSEKILYAVSSAQAHTTTNEDWIKSIKIKMNKKREAKLPYDELKKLMSSNMAMLALIGEQQVISVAQADLAVSSIHALSGKLITKEELGSFISADISGMYALYHEGTTESKAEQVEALVKRIPDGADLKRCVGGLKNIINSKK